jgi:gluconate 5-dehydrogenase
VRSLFLYAQAAAKAWMIPNRWGRIVNVASVAGLAGSINVDFVAYGTSKAAAINLSRMLAGEWGEYGITVNALAPGFFPSKMTRATLAELGVEKLSEAVPLRRIGDEDDLKGAVLLFASAAGKHITGQVLAVDGGISAVHYG